MTWRPVNGKRGSVKPSLVQIFLDIMMMSQDEVVMMYVDDVVEGSGAGVCDT